MGYSRSIYFTDCLPAPSHQASPLMIRVERTFSAIFQHLRDIREELDREPLHGPAHPPCEAFGGPCIERFDRAIIPLEDDSLRCLLLREILKRDIEAEGRFPTLSPPVREILRRGLGAGTVPPRSRYKRRPPGSGSPSSDPARDSQSPCHWEGLASGCKDRTPR